MQRLVIGILAHVDAGKTTLSEAILYKTEKIRKLGERTIYYGHGNPTVQKNRK